MNPELPNLLTAQLKANPSFFEDMDEALLGDLVLHYMEGGLAGEDAAEVEALLRTNAKAKAIQQRLDEANRFIASEKGRSALDGLLERVLPRKQNQHREAAPSLFHEASFERHAEDLALANDPLPFPVSELSDVLKRSGKANRGDAANSSHLALAAAEDALPELHSIDHLLPGFTGDATGDGCAPSQSSVLRLACTATESPRPQTVPQSIIAIWPTGQTPPIPVLYRAGRWRFDVPLPLPWPQTHALLASGSIRIITL